VPSPAESVAQVIPNVACPKWSFIPAERSEAAPVTGTGTGVTSTVRFRAEADWQPVRTSAPAARRKVTAVRGKELFLPVLMRADTARRINRARSSRVLNAGTGPITEGTFACGIPG
jgi:hypothetical protein